MFGYVRIDKSELKIKEFETYKAIYCSLCKRLGKRYGLIARLSLSYDFTALAMLNLSLSPDCTGFCKGKCVYNPFKRCVYCSDFREIDKAADYSVILLYYKFCDDVQDHNGIKKVFFRVLRFLFRRQYKKAVLVQPEIDILCKNYMNRQEKCELKRTDSIDEAADPTGELIQKMVLLEHERFSPKETLGKFGYFLGRYIYLSDAADDIIDDIKGKRYNPFVCSLKIKGKEPDEEQKQQIKEILNHTSAELLSSYQNMQLTKYSSIMMNIITEGIPKVIDGFFDKEKGMKTHE